jgi:hypothetical protein
VWVTTLSSSSSIMEDATYSQDINNQKQLFALVEKPVETVRLAPACKPFS